MPVVKVCEDMGRAAILLGEISFNAALYAAWGLGCMATTYSCEPLYSHAS